MKTPNEFCISELYIKQDTFNSPYLYSPNFKLTRYHFAIIEEGSLKISHLNETIYAHKGDVIFYPKGISFTSQWNGNPNINKWDIIFSFNSDILSNFTIQKISGISDEIVKLSRSMYNNFKIGSDNIPFAYADFYTMLGLILPYLKSSSNSLMPKTLVDAIEYIKMNLLNDIKVSDIAQHCSTCESNLYHLFKNELHSTPINYINSSRIALAIDYMKKDRSIKLSSVSELCGFNSDTHFRQVFTKFTHTTPSKYRKLFCK